MMNHPTASRRELNRVRRRQRKGSNRLTFGKAILWLLLFALCMLILIPLFLTFLYSFFPKSEISAFLGTRNNYDEAAWIPTLLSPAQVSIRQYYTILIEEPKYLSYFLNSIMYAAAILALQGLVIPMTAYGLSRFHFHGRDALFFFILMLMLLPFQVTMAPSVYTLRYLGLMDTVWAVILPMACSPFYIFLLRQFMVMLPNELLEAGMIDGAGTFRGYVHVVLPSCKPILAAAAALSFADCWNMVEQPLLYVSNRPDLQPLSIMFNQISTDGADVAFAGSALYLLPAMLIYLYLQDDIIKGVQLSSMK